MKSFTKITGYPYKPWTAEETLYVADATHGKKLRGYVVRPLAKELNRTDGSVHNAIYRVRNGKSKWVSNIKTRHLFTKYVESGGQTTLKFPPQAPREKREYTKKVKTTPSTTRFRISALWGLFEFNYER